MISNRACSILCCLCLQAPTVAPRPNMFLRRCNQNIWRVPPSCVPVSFYAALQPWYKALGPVVWHCEPGQVKVFLAWYRSTFASYLLVVFSLHDPFLSNPSHERDLSLTDKPLPRCSSKQCSLSRQAHQFVCVLSVCGDLLTLPAALTEVDTGEICDCGCRVSVFVDGDHLCCQRMLCNDGTQSAKRVSVERYQVRESVGFTFCEWHR